MVTTNRTLAADGLQEDTQIFPVMVALAGCIAAEFEESGLGQTEPNLAVGDTYALEVRDDCEDADTWIRISSAYPSQQIPIQSVDQRVVDLGFILEVGAAQCFEDPGQNEVMPTELYLELARKQTAQMSALKRAICSCLEQSGREWSLQDYLPQGPQGGVFWGTWQVNVATLLR